MAAAWRLRPKDTASTQAAAIKTPESMRLNSRLAEEAMHRLVDACTSVPGGSTRFTVTLLPGGRIDLTQGPDQPDTIPTCVLKNDLRHRVALPKPCSLVVKLEETSVPLADVDAGERDAR